MMKQKELVPKRRFEGFINEWETYELKEILHVNSGRDYKHLNKGNVPVYGTGGLMLKVDDKLSEVDGIGIGRKGTINKPQYLKAPFWTVDTLFFMTPVFKSNLYFMYSKSQTIDWKSMDESTGVPSLSKDTIEKINLFKPRYKEQQRIGQFFKHLDEMITLEQRKIDKTKALKSAYLAEMFPAVDEHVPKRRFAGFTDEWEVRKLGDLVESFEYGLNASGIEYDGENKYLRITDIDDETRLFNKNGLTSPNTDLMKAENYLLRKNDILFARTGASVGKTYHYQEYDGKVYYAGFLIRGRIKSDFSSEFIFQNTITAKYDNFIKVTSQRSGQPGVNAQEYASFQLTLPSKEEQQKIGSFFKKIDDIITTNQNKIDKLKATKQAYLNEMFV